MPRPRTAESKPSLPAMPAHTEVVVYWRLVSPEKHLLQCVLSRTPFGLELSVAHPGHSSHRVSAVKSAAVAHAISETWRLSALEKGCRALAVDGSDNRLPVA